MTTERGDIRGTIEERDRRPEVTIRRIYQSLQIDGLKPPLNRIKSFFQRITYGDKRSNKSSR